MKTIIFYNDSKRYLGWKKLRSLRSDYWEIVSWITSGNFLKIGNNLTKDINVIFKHYQY